MRAIGLAFSVIAYVVFFATFLYLVAFVGGLPFAPLTVDSGGPVLSPAAAVVIDAALIAVFGVQHSVMARQGFKRAWTRIVPHASERSIYVLASSLVLLTLFAFWAPIPTMVWRTQGAVAILIWALFAAGWAIVLLSTFLINHFELFGLQQAWQSLRGASPDAPRFRTPLFYRLVRHPLYTGFIIAFWAAPVMTIGHLLLAGGITVYIVIAIGYEERDLTAMFGNQYEDYRRRVGMLIPGLGKRT